MEISTEIGSFRRYGTNREILRLLKDSGFTAYDFSMFRGTLKDRLIDSENYREDAKALREYADSIGLRCNQAHAPFPTARKGNESYNESAFPEIARAIEVSGILGAKVCVVHPCNDYTAEENASLYRRFEPYARRAGVKIGVENMWNWDDKAGHACAAACSSPDSYLAHLALLDEEVFTACLDIGHAEMAGLGTSAPEMIAALGRRLGAMHLHDNDKGSEVSESTLGVNVNGYGRGDELVVVDITIPAKLTSEEKRLVEQLAAQPSFQRAESVKNQNIFERMKSFFR